jgi:hypothetical protein
MSTARLQEITMLTAQNFAVRRAIDADQHVLERLAALDSSSPPRGEVLIAFVDGRPLAAVGVETGATVADPFHPTADVVEMLQTRARRLRAHRPERRNLMRVLRAGYRTA